MAIIDRESIYKSLYFRRNSMYKMKNLFVKTVARNLISLLENKNFMQKKGSQISQNDAQNAEKQEDKKTEERCMMLFVLNVVLKHKFHLDRFQVEKFFVKLVSTQKNKSNNLRV